MNTEDTRNDKKAVDLDLMVIKENFNLLRASSAELEVLAFHLNNSSSSCVSICDSGNAVYFFQAGDYAVILSEHQPILGQ